MAAVRCPRCGLMVFPGRRAPDPYAFHTEPQDCIDALKAALEALRKEYREEMREAQRDCGAAYAEGRAEGRGEDRRY